MTMRERNGSAAVRAHSVFVILNLFQDPWPGTQLKARRVHVMGRPWMLKQVQHDGGADQA
jgi:hypothetical protein